MTMNAQEAIARLKAGNALFVEEPAYAGDISQKRVKQLSEEGQAPFACIVACADSRVVPEHLFMVGLGDVFTIRVAGNVIGDMELASCVYAAEHLGVKLIVVLGHTQCGAVASALEVLAAGTEPEGAMAPLLSCVCASVVGERDPQAASIANLRAGVAAIEGDDDIAHLIQTAGLRVVPALYHTEDGTVGFMEL